MSNILADFHSRFYADSSDWRLDPEICHRIKDLWWSICLLRSGTRSWTVLLAGRINQRALQRMLWAWIGDGCEGTSSRRSDDEVEGDKHSEGLTSLSTTTFPVYYHIPRVLPHSPCTTTVWDVIDGSHGQPSPSAEQRSFVFIAWRFSCSTLRRWAFQQMLFLIIELFLEGNRAGNSRAYQSAWKLWIDWRRSGSFDPMSPSLAQVLEYVSFLVSSGKAYKTINVHRSMLSSTLPAIDVMRSGSIL